MASVTSITGRLPSFTFAMVDQTKYIKLTENVLFGQCHDRTPVYILYTDDPRINFVITPLAQDTENGNLQDLI